MVLEVSQLWGLFCSLKLFAQLSCIQKPRLVPRSKRPRVFTGTGKDFCLCVGWLKIYAVVLPDFQHVVGMQRHICSDWMERRVMHEMATILVAASTFFQHLAFLGQKQKLADTRDMEFRGRISKIGKVKINMQNGYNIWHSLNLDMSNMKHFRTWNDFSLRRTLLLLSFV